jgi:hypothetical protein
MTMKALKEIAHTHTHTHTHTYIYRPNPNIPNEVVILSHST